MKSRRCNKLNFKMKRQKQLTIIENTSNSGIFFFLLATVKLYASSTLVALNL